MACSNTKHEIWNSGVAGKRVLQSNISQLLGYSMTSRSRRLTLPALRRAVATVAPGRLPEMFAKIREEFERAGEQGSVTPIHMFYREWAVIVEIERHPETARRLHAAEQDLMSDDPQTRDAAIHNAGENERAAHRAVAGLPMRLWCCR